MKSVVQLEGSPPWKFGGFTLSRDRHALFSDGERVKITEKPLATLIYLVENRGRVVEKGELLDSVWTGTFVTEDTLVHAVREIRRALGDDRENPKFVQTVPRRGYRFVGEVYTEALPDEAVPDEYRPEYGDRRPQESAGRPALSGPLPMTVLIAIGTIAVVLAIVTGTYFLRRPEHKAIYETQEQLTFGEFSAGKPAYSPDGKLMLCVWSSPETRGHGDIFVTSPSEGRFIRITTDENPSGDMPVFGSDGMNVVYSRYRSGNTGNRLPDLFIVPTSGLTSPRLFISGASGAGFTTDGTAVAYTKHLESGKPLWLSRLDDLENHIEIAPLGFTPRFSPDGNWIAYTTSNPEGGLGDLWIADTRTFAVHRNVTGELQQFYGLAWATDSRSVIASSKRTGLHLLWQIPIDGGELKTLMPTYGGYAVAPAIAPGSDKLAFQYGRIAKDIFLAKTSGGVPERLTTGENHEAVRLSPSGTEVASVVQGHDYRKELSVLALDGGRKARRFGLREGSLISISWLDDFQIAYLVGERNFNVGQIFVLNVNNGMSAPLAAFDGEIESFAVDPQRKSIAAIRVERDGVRRIVLRDLESNRERVIAEGGEYAQLRWVPDGSSLGWSGPDRAVASPSSGVWLWSRDSGNIRRIALDGYAPVWSPDLRSAFYSRMGGEGFGLVENRDGERLVRDWADNVRYFDVAGEKVVFVQAEELIRAQIFSVQLSR
jgi:DNA-binding winged helix-turn-helix (wHTH) protein/Tol biopolymer transport system component